MIQRDKTISLYIYSLTYESMFNNNTFIKRLREIIINIYLYK